MLSQKSIAGSSRYFVMEGNIGVGMRENQNSKVIGGFGLWRFWHITDVQGRRKGSLGISSPIRYEMTSPNETVLIDYKNSLSVATLFRVSIQQHPTNDTFWFFLGAGPELRTIWGNGKSQNLPMIQQEIGMRMYRPNAIHRDNELGFSVSWPLSRQEWNDEFRILTFFMRIAVF